MSFASRSYLFYLLQGRLTSSNSFGDDLLLSSRWFSYFLRRRFSTAFGRGLSPTCISTSVERLQELEDWLVTKYSKNVRHMALAVSTGLFDLCEAVTVSHTVNRVFGSGRFFIFSLLRRWFSPLFRL